MSSPIRPSEVTDFNRCPRLWWYKHVDGWSAPPSAWSPERLMGSAVHAGLANYWSAKSFEAIAHPDHALRAIFDRDWPPTAPPEFSREGLESQALKVLDAVLKWTTKEMPDAEPVMVEQALRKDGCTPDLVTKEPGGYVITDWKYSHFVEPDRVRYKLVGLERTHQFLDYLWEVAKHLPEPPYMFRKVVIVGNPRIMVKEATLLNNPQMIEQWLAGARQIWHDMATMRTGEAVAYQRTGGCLQYGPKWPCEMWEACWTCYGDRRKMEQFYVKRDS